jgi:hypothetical protein
MSDDNIITSFLVGLGIKVDEAGLKKVANAVKQVEKAALEMSAALEAAATATALAVGQISSKFEDLYYASQRIGASVENIQAFGFALNQVGGSAQGARNALEGVAAFIRNNPGGENWIEHLGVSTRTANGEWRDTKLILDDLAVRFRQMPFWAARVRAQMLGIDDNTLMAMRRGTAQFSDEYHAAAKRYGVDQEQMAAASHVFMTRVRDVQMNISLMFSKIAMDLLNTVGPQLDRFASWFERNGPVIGARIEAIGKPILVIGTYVATAGARVVGWFVDLDRATRGWSTALVGALLAWRVLNLGFIATPIGAIVTGILALGVAIVGLADDIQTYFGGGKSLINWGAFVDGFNAVYRALVDGLNAFLSFIEPITTTVGELWQQLAGAFASNSASIVSSLRDARDAIKQIWDDLSPYMRETLKEWAQQVGDFAKLVVDAIAVLLKAFGPVVIDAIKATVKELADALRLMADALKFIADLLGGHWSSAWKDAEHIAVDAMKGILDMAKATAGALADLWHGVNPLMDHKPTGGQPVQVPNDHPLMNKPAGNNGRPSALVGLWQNLTHGIGNWVAGAAQSTQAPQTSAQQRALAQQVMGYFQGQGWSKAQSAGIAANLLAESGLKAGAVGDNGTAYGLAQWHPDRQSEFAKWAGHSIMGSSFQEQLAFVQYELTRGMRKAAGDSLRRIDSASASGSAVSLGYENPKDNFWHSKALARGQLADQLFAQTYAVPRGASNASVELNQTTTIQVHGSDPKATAQATADAQDRVNGNLLRHAQGAIS